MPLPRSKRPTNSMCITQAGIAIIHPFFGGDYYLPRMHRSTHGVTDPFFREHRGERNLETKDVHVEHDMVMIRSVRATMT